MKKLRLSVDDLEVVSFEATPAGSEGGTVRGHDSIQYCPTGLSYCGENQCNTETGACSPSVCQHTCDAAVNTCGYTCPQSCGGSCGSECCQTIQLEYC